MGTPRTCEEGDPALHVIVEAARVLVGWPWWVRGVGAVGSVVARLPDHVQQQRPIGGGCDLRVGVERRQDLFRKDKRPAWDTRVARSIYATPSN